MFKLSLAFGVSLVAAQTPDLPTYCAALATQCISVQSLNTTVCQIAMANVPLGSIGDGDTNSIGCRYKYLNDPNFNTNPNACWYAGPTGGGRCGPVINNVCNIATTVCNGVSGQSYPDSPTCVTGLTPIQHQWGSTQGSSSAAENSLECRVYHAIASVTTGASVHCSHYNYTNSPCSGAVKPSVAHYCTTLEYNCGNTTSAAATAQFAFGSQCNATASYYPNAQGSDARNDNSDNSLGCREYHSQASRADPATHCEHAGPSGAGVCGTRLQAWASIIAAPPCSDPSVGLFITSVGNATANLGVPTGVSTATPYVPYSTTFDTSLNTQICRIYHLGVASTTPSHCAHGTLDGGSNCGLPIPNLCTLIGAVCGFGTGASQYADATTCSTALTAAANNVTLGLPTDTSQNTLQCRFYHATVAGSYLPTGSMGAVTGAAALVTTHCGHVLTPALAGGCGAPGASPTAAPKSSPASALSVAASLVVVVASVFSL